MTTNDTQIKCLLVGSAGVGKTSLIQMLRTNNFVTKYIATLGVEVHPIRIGGIVFHIWDMAGQEKFQNRDFESNCMAGQCAIIMFDCTNQLSCSSVPQWYMKIQKVCGNIPIAVCRNKVDIKVKATSTLDSENTKHYDISVKFSTKIRMPFMWFAKKIEGVVKE